jgi:hypothetical protein
VFGKSCYGFSLQFSHSFLKIILYVQETIFFRVFMLDYIKCFI